MSWMNSDSMQNNNKNPKTYLCLRFIQTYFDDIYSWWWRWAWWSAMKENDTDFTIPTTLTTTMTTRGEKVVWIEFRVLRWYLLLVFREQSIFCNVCRTTSHSGTLKQLLLLLLLGFTNRISTQFFSSYVHVYTIHRWIFKLFSRRMAATPKCYIVYHNGEWKACAHRCFWYVSFSALYMMSTCMKMSTVR